MPTTIEVPPGRRPLKVAAVVLPPAAVTKMTLAPPSACRACAGSLAALVDVVMSTQFLCQFGLVGTTGNGHHLESHVPGILDSQMAQAADAENGHQVTGLRR